MKRVGSLARVLWSITTAGSLGACGRIGFGDSPVAAVATSLALRSECGVAVTPGELAIENQGTAPLVIDQATATGGFSIVTPLPVTIAPGAVAALRVAPPPAVIGTDVGGAQKTGVLTIVTNEGETPSRDIALTATVVGANIAITDATSAALTLTFSGSSGLCPAPQPAYLANTGNAPVTLDAGAASGLALSGFSGGTLDPGASAMVLVWVTTGSACVGSGAVTYVVTGSACTTTPTVLQATFNITGSSSCFCT
jgi:hypothetical protein